MMLWSLIHEKVKQHQGWDEKSIAHIKSLLQILQRLPTNKSYVQILQ